MHVAVIALLAVGVALVVLSAIGVAVIGAAFTRLHLITPASTLGVPLICVAVMLDQGTARLSLKVGIIALLSLIGQPAVTAATARALARSDGIDVDAEP